MFVLLLHVDFEVVWSYVLDVVTHSDLEVVVEIWVEPSDPEISILIGHCHLKIHSCL